MVKKIAFWFNNARYVSLPQSLLPALLAVAMASNEVDFSCKLSVLAVIGVLFMHLAMNLADDYFDYKKDNGAKVREQMASKGIRARIAKCAYLENQQASLNELLFVIVLLLILALSCGGVILWYRGISILYIALIAGVLGVSYSASPLRLGYRGLGELVIGLMFGPMLMLGVYLSAGGVYNSDVLWVSSAVGLLVVNILFSHSIMDALPDEAIGKMTFARLLKTKFKMLFASALFNLFPFVIISLGVLLGNLHWYYLLSYILLPLAAYLYYYMYQFVYDNEVDLEPKWWMGSMQNWETIKEAKIEWFMIRWYMARNLISFFCLLLICVNLFL